MINFELEIWDESSSLVTYYTVLKNGESETETDKFFAKIVKIPNLRPSLNDLSDLLLDIYRRTIWGRLYFFQT
jgi:hypothetical protein